MVKCLSPAPQGYSHVGSRLLSHKIIYEETGWYDGELRWTCSMQVLQTSEHGEPLQLHLPVATRVQVL